MICVFINMTGTPEGSTESGFMEKPGIEIWIILELEQDNLVLSIVSKFCKVQI